MLLVPWLIFNPVAIIVYIISILIAIIHHSGDNSTFFIIGHLVMGTIVSCKYHTVTQIPL
jgi:cobalamin biosynthesis protein CobD/CbiB